MNKYHLLLPSVIVALSGCHSELHYQEQAVESAREYIYKHARELTAEQYAFVKLTPPVLFSGTVLRRNAAQGVAGTVSGSGRVQVCIAWRIPEQKNDYLVFGITDAGMNNWTPARLIRRPINFIDENAAKALGKSRSYAMASLHEQMTVSELNFVRFSHPELILSSFDIGTPIAEESEDKEKKAPENSAPSPNPPGTAPAAGAPEAAPASPAAPAKVAEPTLTTENKTAAAPAATAPAAAPATPASAATASTSANSGTAAPQTAEQAKDKEAAEVLEIEEEVVLPRPWKKHEIPVVGENDNVQLSLVWKLGPDRYAVFCGVGKPDMEGWEIALAGIFNAEEMKKSCVEVVKTKDQYLFTLEKPENQGTDKNGQALPAGTAPAKEGPAAPAPVKEGPAAPAPVKEGTAVPAPVKENTAVPAPVKDGTAVSAPAKDGTAVSAPVKEDTATAEPLRKTSSGADEKNNEKRAAEGVK